MQSTLVITGTNRPDSYTGKISAHLIEMLRTDTQVEALSLDQINHYPWIHDTMYAGINAGSAWEALQEEWLIPHKNWIWVLPEYNGSFPGIVKVFIDILSVHKAKETFKNKKMGLVGVATGRAGNLRGLDHLTSILHHMNSDVMPFKLPVSSVHLLLDENGNMKPELQSSLHLFCDYFRTFTK